MKGTCEELYQKGFLKEGYYYFENCYYFVIKKFLFFRFRCSKKFQRILMFKGKDFDGCYVFRYVFRTNDNCGIEFLSGYSYMGIKCDLNIKRIKKVFLK